MDMPACGPDRPDGDEARPILLLIDDDREVSQTFARWLTLSGYAVRTAPDGEAGLREVAGVDAIVLDVRMPLLDGLGFLRRARADHCDVPVAVVTGDYLIDDATLSEFERLGARIVYKPLWMDDLTILASDLTGRSVHV
jgi:DNA-binding response OmpR family regulator